MDRRKFIAGIGALSAAGAVGTGAFTSVEADRTVSVSVAGDANAFLAMDASSTANGEFASINGDDQIELDFSDSSNGGDGLGLDSTYEFDDVFRITNQGTQPVYVWANFSGGSLDDNDIWFYPGSNSDRELNDGTNEVVTLPVGETVEMGVYVDTSVLSSTGTENLTATLTASVDVPNSSSPTGPSGEDAAVVSEDPDDGEYGSIQGAIDDVDGTTVFVEPGTYDESVVVDKSGISIVGTDDPNTDPATVNGQGSTAFEVRADGVTIRKLRIRNPSGSPSGPDDYAGAVGVTVQSGNTGVTVRDTVLTDIGTENDDANPMAVYAQGATSGITVENNRIQNLEGTDEDQGSLQAIHINSQKGMPTVSNGIDNARVAGNTVSDLRDTRSTVAVRFNGDVSGEIANNTISGLNTEGDIPGTNDPGGFTQVISLAKGGNSTTGPSDVEIKNNTISNIETTTPDNFAPPYHLSVASSASSLTVTGNSFSADSPDVEAFVGDGSGTLDLTSVKNNNTFAPSAQIDGDTIYPGDLRIVEASDDLQTAIDNAGTDVTLAVEPGTFDAVTVDKSLSLTSIFGRPTIEADSNRIEVSATDVEISGFDIDLQNGQVVYANPGEGLTFRNNVVDISGSSSHGLRIDAGGTSETSVVGNVFNQPPSTVENPQAILFSDGSNYRIKDNVLNGSGEGAGILVSTQGNPTTDFQITNNEISNWISGVFLYANPTDGEINNGSITNNEITNYDGFGIEAVDPDEDGFANLNGESTASEQEVALKEDNGDVPADVRSTLAPAE